MDTELSQAQQGIVDFLSLSPETSQRLYELFCHEDTDYRHSDADELINMGDSLYAGLVRTLQQLEQRGLISRLTDTADPEWSLTGAEE